MKHLSRQCKNSNQVNSYLASIGLGDFAGFCFHPDGSFFPDFNSSSADFDGWLDSEETKGASISVTKDLEVLVVKYTKSDIEKLESELE